MKFLMVGMLALAIFGAPCAYDLLSTEPPPLASIAMAFGSGG